MPRKAIVKSPESTDRFRKLDAFYHMHRRMPSYQEAVKVLGVKSKDTAYRYIRELIVLGFLERDSAGKLIPKTTAQKSPLVHSVSHTHTASQKSPIAELKVLGLIEAGFPTPAEESLLESISLDEWLIPKREASFMLKVKGHSMKDAGINDGDMVIAERANTAPVGSIVVAEIDGDWTLKYLRRNSKGYYLEAANDEYPDLRPKEKLSIAAIVRGVIRKY
jgi:SOS regulatory protein LexA